MNILKKIIIVILSVLISVSPLAFATVVALATPPQYSESFFGALDEKYDRLNSVEEEKIVVIGGSSVAFGLDSKRLEEYTGMPVVNFGLYANLGTKMMLDLSLSGIERGDVVVLAPELDPETLSLYFNNESALMALDDDFSMMLRLKPDDFLSCVGGMWNFASDKWSRYVGDNDYQTDGIYRSEHFNSYGDFALVREENIMPFYYDTNNTVRLNSDILGDDFYDFCDYLNKYIKKCERRGATVYFSYCPINELALDDGSDKASREEFCDLLEENIDCEFISYIDDYILDAGYFFDTNFHLNDSGVMLRTIRLAKDIRLSHGIVQGIIKDEEPEAPALPFFDVIIDTEDENARYFTFSLLENGAYGISGLSEIGKKETRLVIPVGYDGRKVVAILEGALNGSAVSELVITENSNIARIDNGAFVGASNLKDLYIYKVSEDDISPPADFYGVNPDFKLHVPIGSNYSTGYKWTNKGINIVFDIVMS